MMLRRWLSLDNFALATDLYELTMAAAYFDNRDDFEATFELFVRNFPKNRSYLLAAGLEQAADYLTHLRFSEEQVNFLRDHPSLRDVSEAFFEYLRKLRFTGEVWALPEGTVFFTNEPVIRVTAPIIQAQVIETFLLSLINFETLIATKASRIVQSARKRSVIEFGSRRAHGPEAALLAARASYIGGCIGTSNVLAGNLFKIPIYGTMAHSFIMSYDSEIEAFEKFRKVFPHPAFLVDTYDSIEGVKNAISMGAAPTMIRLDSGDRLEISKRARKILDKAGFSNTKIFVSGDLNEFIINDLTSRRAPIDMFGVGTELVTSRDDPSLQGIYKLVSVKREGNTIHRAKTSEGKRTIPGVKQIYRRYSSTRMIKEDIVALANEERLSGTVPLLVKVVQEGRLVSELPSIEEIQEYASRQLAALSPKYRRLAGASKPRVRLSAKLREAARNAWAGHHA